MCRYGCYEFAVCANGIFLHQRGIVFFNVVRERCGRDTNLCGIAQSVQFVRT